MEYWCVVEATNVKLEAGSRGNKEDLKRYTASVVGKVRLEDTGVKGEELQEMLLERASGYFANLRFLHGLLNANPQAEEDCK